MVPENKPFHSLPFLDNELVAVAPKGHPILKQKQAKLNDFLNSGLLVREQGSGSRRAIEDFVEDSALT